MSYLRVISAGLLAAAFAAGVGCEGDAVPSDADAVVFKPATLQLRRLLARQYRGTVGELFGPDAALVASPPQDSSLNGFKSIAASQLALSNALVSDYESSARAVATVASEPARMDAMAGCHPKRPDDEVCMRQFVERLGKRVFRRPLTPNEVDDYLQVAMQGANHTRDFYAGTRFAIIALLQSPNFLYQIEVGRNAQDEPIDEVPSKGDDVRTLTHYELASRMSFLLLDRGPDEALLAAAEAGQLDSAAGISAIAEQMLTTGDAAKAVRAFFREYLSLEGLDTLAKDPSMFPQFSGELAASLEQETLKLVEDIIFVRNAPVPELFTAPYTFINAGLAEIYQLDPPEAAVWHRVTLSPEQGRVGILGHASILASQAHPTSTSATYRGLFIMERFFCTSMPPPPPEVVTELPPSSLAPTLRERLAVHLAEPSCRACHYQSDNLGLALENFDAIGAYRTHENGALIDATGDTDPLGKFDGLAEMAPLLANSEIVTRCMVRQLYRHASGHIESTDETPIIDDLHTRFRDGDYRFKSLLIALVASPAFRTIAFTASGGAGAQP